MKNLYLHIGQPKTATSSLQKFCDLNQEVLRDYGFSYRIAPFSYPNVSKRRNGHFLVGPSSSEENISREEQQEYQDRLHDGLDFLHAQFDQCDNVILTEEHLWYALNYTQWDTLQILKDDAASYGYTVKALVYLRRQDTFMVSNWNQLIKKGHLKCTIEAQESKILNTTPLVLHYDRALDKIASGIGKENLIVRRFEASSWVNGTIYADFLDALGLDPSMQVQLPSEYVNQSLKNNFVEIKRRINCDKSIPEDTMAYLTNCLKKASAAQTEHEEYGILSSGETRQFLDLFKEGNDRVAKEYIQDGKPLFSDEIKEVKKWQPDNEYMDEDIACFLSELIKEDPDSFISELIRKQKKDDAKQEKLKSTRYCMDLTLRSLRRRFQAKE